MEQGKDSKELDPYRYTEGNKKKIYTLHHSISSVSKTFGGKKDCKRLLHLTLANLGGLGLYPFSFKVRGKKKTQNGKKNEVSCTTLKIKHKNSV